MPTATLSQQIVHMTQLAMILAAGLILILFAHQYIPPEVVYTSTIASVAGVIGARIAQNGYAPVVVATPVTPVVPVKPLEASPPASTPL